MHWFTLNKDGFWCNVCGEHLKSDWDFECEEEMHEYVDKMEDQSCQNCGAPDDINPDAI